MSRQNNSFPFTYDIKAHTIDLSQDLSEEFNGMELHFDNMPYSFADEYVYEPDKAAYFEMYQKIEDGARFATTDFRTISPLRWNRVCLVRDGDYASTAFGIVQDVTDIYKRITEQEQERKSIKDAYQQVTKDSELLINGICNVYDIVFIVNLTKNTYRRIDNTPYVPNLDKEGSYDGAVEETLKSVLPEYRDGFRNKFSRENLLKAYAKGFLGTDYEYRRYNDNKLNGEEDTTINWVHTHTLFSVDQRSGDIMEVSLTQRVDERKDADTRQMQIMKDALVLAQNANTAKSQFLTNMSHDIRTPMNAIMGYARLLQKGVDSPATAYDYVDNIVAAGEHLERLINNVLDLARIEAGKSELVPEEMHLDQLQKDIRSVIYPLAEKKHIELLLDTSMVEHPHFYADKQKIEQILINICGNAVKFTNEGGKVFITVTETDSLLLDCRKYIFSVRDTGIGMSEEFVEHVFETFARERSSTESMQQGTGLGMPIAKNLVEMMGGNIRVQSTVGAGTEFVFELPLVPLAFEESDSAEVYRQAHVTHEIKKLMICGTRVLLVEDNPVNRKLARIILEEMDVLVEFANNGQVALDRLHACADWYYDYILMDVQMPVMDGLEASRRIRSSEREYLQKIPIIAVSADAFTENKQKGLKAGMNKYVTKPYKEEDLVAAMYECRGILKGEKVVKDRYTSLEEFESGFIEIDAEHELLVEMCNHMVFLLKSPTRELDRKKLAQKLLHFAEIHFHDEEAYLARTKDPILPLQKQKHEQILREAGKYLEEQPVDDAAFLQLLDNMYMQIRKHIKADDVMIGRLQE